jgi:hypothetical protein
MYTQRLSVRPSVRPSVSEVHCRALRQNTALTVKQGGLFDTSGIASQTVSPEQTNRPELRFTSFSTERYKIRLLAAPRVWPQVKPGQKFDASVLILVALPSHFAVFVRLSI